MNENFKSKELPPRKFFFFIFRLAMEKTSEHECELCYKSDPALLAKKPVRCVTKQQGYIYLCDSHEDTFAGYKETIRCECTCAPSYITIYDPRSCQGNPEKKVRKYTGGTLYIDAYNQGNVRNDFMAVFGPSDFKYYGPEPTDEQKQKLALHTCSACNGRCTIDGLNVWVECVVCGDVWCSYCAGIYGSWFNVESFTCDDCCYETEDEIREA